LNFLELNSEEKVGEKKKDAMEGDIPSPSVQAQRFPCFLKTVTENNLKNRMVSPSSFSLWSLPLDSMQFYRTTQPKKILTQLACYLSEICVDTIFSVFMREKGSEVFCRRHTFTIVKANDMGFVFPSESSMQFSSKG
jgi:hypothetical protein